MEGGGNKKGKESSLVVSSKRDETVFGELQTTSLIHTDDDTMVSLVRFQGQLF